MVNAMLAIIGESPIQTIDLSHPDVQLALDLWDENSTLVQSKGWWYNTEVYQLLLDARTNEVFLPPNTITIDNANTNYIKRGRVLYDLENHTRTFPDTTDTTDLVTKCIMFWSIGELPTTIYMYILLLTKMAMVMARDKEAEVLRGLELQINVAFDKVNREHVGFHNPNRQQVNNAALMLSRQPIRRVI